jgi:hypothetical protein
MHSHLVGQHKGFFRPGLGFGPAISKETLWVRAHKIFLGWFKARLGEQIFAPERYTQKRPWSRASYLQLLTALAANIEFVKKVEGATKKTLEKGVKLGKAAKKFETDAGMYIDALVSADRAAKPLAADKNKELFAAYNAALNALHDAPGVEANNADIAGFDALQGYLQLDGSLKLYQATLKDQMTQFFGCKYVERAKQYFLYSLTNPANCMRAMHILFCILGVVFTIIAITKVSSR